MPFAAFPAPQWHHMLQHSKEMQSVTLSSKGACLPSQRAMGDIHLLSGLPDTCMPTPTEQSWPLSTTWILFLFLFKGLFRA